MNRVDLGILGSLTKEQLKSYLEFLLWHYRVLDGFWFLSVEKRYNRTAAEELDGAVWEKIAGMSATDIVERFNITGGGLKGLALAMQYCPWTMIVGYRIEERPGEVILTVPE
jgi:hypothetical protein